MDLQNCWLYFQNIFDIQDRISAVCSIPSAYFPPLFRCYYLKKVPIYYLCSSLVLFFLTFLQYILSWATRKILLNHIRSYWDPPKDPTYLKWSKIRVLDRCLRLLGLPQQEAKRLNDLDNRNLFSHLLEVCVHCESPLLGLQMVTL